MGRGLTPIDADKTQFEKSALIRVPNLTMNWQPYIHSDPNILVGKPVVKGTRLAVDFILSLFAVGWTQEQVLESYPTLTPESLRAVLVYQEFGRF